MQRGKQEASEDFARLVREHRRAVFSIAYAKVRNVHDAEDITQEVFIEAFRNVHKLGNPGKTSAWLYKAAIYRCKDHFRKMARRERRERTYADSVETKGQMVTHEKKEYREAVVRAIGELPEKYRLVVMLKHFAHLSYAEISKMTSLSKTTIDGRLRMAKERLREKLIEMGVDGD